MNQRSYAHQVLEYFGMENCAPATTPMQELMVDLNAEPCDLTCYCSMVGKLNHLTHTRFDISTTVGICSRFLACHQQLHLQAAGRVITNIKHTSDYGILYLSKPNTNITGFVDTDWARDMTDGRSTMGFIFMLGSSPITWLLKKQPKVAMSSIELEYIGLSTTSKEAAWLAKLTSDFGLQTTRPAPIYCDNEGSMCMIVNPNINPRMKHISTHRHFTREKIQNCKIILKYIPS